MLIALNVQCLLACFRSKCLPRSMLPRYADTFCSRVYKSTFGFRSDNLEFDLGHRQHHRLRPRRIRHLQGFLILLKFDIMFMKFLKI